MFQTDAPAAMQGHAQSGRMTPAGMTGWAVHAHPISVPNLALPAGGP